MASGIELSISLVDSEAEGISTAIFRRADGREVYLHSRHNPLEEARFLVMDVPCRERALYVVLGFGLGYHVKALLQRVPKSSHILVIEPDSACLSGWFIQAGRLTTRGWSINDRLHFLKFHAPELAAIYIADRMTRLRLLSLEMITHIPSTLTAEGFYRTLLSRIPGEFPTAFQSNLNILDRMLQNDLRNFWLNLPHTWSATPVSSLSRKWQGLPLIVVSSGPSLSAALPALREGRDKALLLATGSAARILTGRGIRPDLIVAVDPYEANLYHFKDWDAAEVPLVYHHRIHHGILAFYSGPRFFFLMQDEPPLPICGDSGKSGFWRGGSVAFAALQLAHHLEANPIIFVGQDFAFADGHTHAAGCLSDRCFNAGALPPDFFTVPGVDGAPVVTSRIYYSYLLYMQDYLHNFSRLKPGVKHLNTSQLGAKIKGMEYLKLEDALRTHAPPYRLSPREAIASALGQKPSLSRQIRNAELQKWVRELTALLSQADRIRDFGSLFAGFAKTSLYAHSSRSYDDFYYLCEARYRANANLSIPEVADRFKEHLMSVRAALQSVRI